MGIAEKFNNAKKGLKSRDGVKGGFDEGVVVVVENVATNKRNK